MSAAVPYRLHVARDADPADPVPVRLDVTALDGWVSLEEARAYAVHVASFLASLLASIESVETDRATPPAPSGVPS